MGRVEVGWVKRYLIIENMENSIKLTIFDHRIRDDDDGIASVKKGINASFNDKIHASFGVEHHQPYLFAKKMSTHFAFGTTIQQTQSTLDTVSFTYIFNASSLLLHIWPHKINYIFSGLWLQLAVFPRFASKILLLFIKFTSSGTWMAFRMKWAQRISWH